MEQSGFKDPFEGTPKAATKTQYGLDNKGEYERIRNGIVFEQNGLLGVKDTNGTIICEPAYLQIEKCSDHVFFYLPNNTYKYMFPGGLESGYMSEDERPYIVNGKYGLKDKDGRVLLEPIYDVVYDWGGDSDVIYTLQGEEYHYYNHQGEEILTGVRPINVDTEIARTCPYYLSEEQHTEQLVTMEIVNGPIDNHCCQIEDGMWVRLDRIARSEVRDIMGGGELISMGEHALDRFYSRDCYIYSAYIAKGKGKNCIEDCLSQFRKMDCYKSTWAYITRVWVSPKSNIPFDKISKLWTKFKNLKLGKYSIKQKISIQDLTSIAVGVDPSLAEDEIRMMQVIYYEERWPPYYAESDWEDAIEEGSLEDLKRAYTKVQMVCNEIRKNDKSHADWLVRDILSGSISSNAKPQWTWEEEVEIYNYLHSIGHGCTTTLCKMFAKLAKKKSKMTKSQASFLLKKTEWLLAHGSDVNAVVGKRTPLDIVSDPSVLVEPEAMELWTKIAETVKAHGALSSKELELHGVDLVLAEYKPGCVHTDQIKAVFGVNVVTEIHK